MADNILENYKESNKYSNRVIDRCVKNNLIIEKQDNGNLYGNIRILRYYPELQKFGVIVDEEMHNKLYEGFYRLDPDQAERTVRTFETATDDYDTSKFWLHVRDRLGDIWHTEEDIEKIEEIANMLRKLSD